MATSIATQTLVAAFVFGILLQTALGALLIHFKGHGGSIFQDGRRLVLLLFLFFSALWALSDFINLNITSSSTSCQVALAFSTSFDQLARVGIEQFLLWSIGHGTKVTASQLILQTILGVRFIVGAVLVGITRPDFAPVCVARTSVLPIAIAVLGLDAIIIALLAVRSLSIGMPRKEQNKALILVAAGSALWTGTSAVMLLGIHSIALIVKTALPSVGLLILIVIVALSADSLLSPREGAVIPEVTSPFVARSVSFGEETRGIFDNTTPIPGHSRRAAGSQFGVTRPTVPTKEFQNTYQANSRTFISSGKDGRMNSTETNMRSSNMHSTEPSNQELRGVSLLAFEEGSTTVYEWPTVPQVESMSNMERGLPLPAQAPRTLQQKKYLFNWGKSAPKSTVRSMGISNPVVVNTDSPTQPFARIKTIDLATAASMDRERREYAAARVMLTPKRPAPPPPHSRDAGLQKSISLKRKEMPNRRSESMVAIPNSTAPQLLVANGTTTSASLSPGQENIRQRSPRSMNAFGEAADEMVPKQQPLQRKPTIGLPSNPRSQMVAITRVPTIGKGPVVIPPGSKSELVQETPESTYATQLKKTGSILHRPRPYRRDTEKDRALFPTDKYLQHRRSKSGSSIAEARKSIFGSHPGSPTRLPSLPAPPTRASELAHILSSNNKSMTFHEKIQFLFPAPPMSTLTNSRRSSVPSLPRLPSVYMSDSPPLQSPVNDGKKSSSASQRSRVASFETEDIWTFGAPTEADTRNPLPQQSFENLDQLAAVTFVPQEARSAPRAIVDVDQSSTARNAKTTNSRPKVARELKVNVSTWSTSDGTRESFFLDANQDLPGDKTPSPKHMSAWHCRIGDELPTFSERRKNSTSRKMPPPKPLVLNRKGNCVNVIVHSPAPSPVDSPGKAMKVLQAQLKHFDEQNKNSTITPAQHTPATKPESEDNVVDNRDSRTKLLQELEMEMGQQESLWQTMQNNFEYESNSVITTPQPPISSVGGLLQEPLQRNRNSMRRSGTSSISSSQSSSNTKASEWQQRLVEAQMEYLDNIPTLNRNRNLNFLSISQSQIGSPTPPDSVDSETDIESDSELDLEISNSEGGNDMAPYQKPLLWQHDLISPKAAVNGLWNRSSTPPSHSVSLEAPAKDMRPRKRFTQEVLPVVSSVLWSKPSSPSKVTYGGLWRSRKARPTSISIRRASERPQRKSKRIGYLPDIVESPRPLPNKRDTLGIFQFPSGETSDSAVHHAVFSPSLLANAALNILPWEMKAGKPGFDSLEYSSSFFDDYDELEGYEDADSDDDFDESTLWEISNLLLSKDTASSEPSSPVANEIFEVYDEEICFEMVSAREDTITGMPVESPKSIHDPFLDLPIRPLTLISNDRPKLWTGASLTTLNALTKGLPQPDSRTWESYVSKSQGNMRLRPHPSKTLSVLTTSCLWTNTPVEQHTPVAASLWRPTEAAKELPLNSLRAPVTKSNLLWNSQAKGFEQLSGFTAPDTQNSNLAIAKAPMLWTPLTEVDAKPTHMFSDLSVESADHHMDNSLPLRKAGFNQAPLGQLMSSHLWSEQQALEPEHDWISESSVRPESPSTQSGSSSGGSSPTSDTVSMKSSSTKASSIWGSLKSIGISSWNAKTSKTSPSTSPTDNQKSSISPVLPAPRSVASKRESKVLAFRDLFESRASGSEHASHHQRSSLDGMSLEKPISSKATPQDHRAPLNMSDDAAIRDVEKATEPRMWTRSPVNVESTVGFELLWSKDSKMQSSNLFENLDNETTRRPTISKSLRLPVLESSGLWKGAVVINSNHNWLSATNLTQPQMWSSSPKTVQSKSLVLMTVANPSSQDLFSHIKEDRSRKVIAPRALPLPTLNSSQLFESGISVPASPVHWLQSTSRKTVPSLSSLTWTPPSNASITKDKSIGMWTPYEINNTPSPTLFSNPHDKPWIRKKRDPMPTQEITSSKLWRGSISLSLTPMTWTPRVKASMQEDENIGMWTPSEITTLLSPTLFSNPHDTPWIRKKRDPMPTQEITSSTLWRGSTSLAVAPKHWLVDRRSSRVQFRY